MALTGLPLLGLVGVLTAVSLVGTCLAWNRGGRWRSLSRTATLLTCEALVALTIGMVVNRQLDFFPSWSVLLGGTRPATAVSAGNGRLDGYIAREAARRKRDDLSFRWMSPDLNAWQLPQPPVVYVPSAYLRHQQDEFPVVVVLAGATARPAQGAWDDRGIDKLARNTADGGAPAVIVFVRTGPVTAMSVLASALPEQLARDLRVQPDGWAVVGAAGDAPLAPAVAGTSTHFRAVGTVVPGSGATPADVLAGLRGLPSGFATLAVSAVPAPGWPDRREPGSLAPGAAAAAVAAGATDLPGPEAGQATGTGTGVTRSGFGPVWPATPEPTRPPAPEVSRPATTAVPRTGGTPGTGGRVVANRASGTGGARLAVGTSRSGVATPAPTAPDGAILGAGSPDEVRVVAQPAARLGVALQWADRVLPPALAAPVTVVSPVPPPRSPAPVLAHSPNQPVAPGARPSSRATPTPRAAATAHTGRTSTQRPAVTVRG